MLERTLFVLSRAVIIAAPAGLIIWLLANISIDGATLLSCCAAFLDPLAQIIGLDGTILIAFILGTPAKEIVIPLIIMIYAASGGIADFENLSGLKELLVDNGWTWLTALNVMLFSLMHWPCSTTALTIKKETQSIKWTVASIVAPTIAGIAVCFMTSSVASLMGV
jgi:ferrous iron transport protein B